MDGKTAADWAELLRRAEALALPRLDFVEVPELARLLRVDVRVLARIVADPTAVRQPRTPRVPSRRLSRGRGGGHPVRVVFFYQVIDYLRWRVRGSPARPEAA